MTSRRGFLGAIAAALTLDPERALWVPGKKLISIAKAPIIDADTRWVTIHQTMSRAEFERRYPPRFDFTEEWERSLRKARLINKEFDREFARDRDYISGTQWPSVELAADV